MPTIEVPVNVTVPGILPLTFTVRELIAGLFSGQGTLTRPFLGAGVDALGMSWSFFTVPGGYGFSAGPVRHYDRRMIQLAVQHQDLGANTFYSEVHDFDMEGVYFMFNNPLPKQVDFWISPGVQVIFYWLLL